MRLNSNSWVEVSADILHYLAQCERAKVVRTKGYPNALVVLVVATYKNYQNCIEPILQDKLGVQYKYEEWGRKTDGREWLYTLIFTQEPEKARLTTPEELEDDE